MVSVPTIKIVLLKERCVLYLNLHVVWCFMLLSTGPMKYIYRCGLLLWSTRYNCGVIYKALYPTLRLLKYFLALVWVLGTCVWHTCEKYLVTFWILLFKIVKKLPRCVHKARRCQFLGWSPVYESSIGLIHSLQTGQGSSQFHVVYDDYFLRLVQILIILLWSMTCSICFASHRNFYSMMSGWLQTK